MNTWTRFSFSANYFLRYSLQWFLNDPQLVLNWKWIFCFLFSYKTDFIQSLFTTQNDENVFRSAAFSVLTSRPGKLFLCVPFTFLAPKKHRKSYYCCYTKIERGKKHNERVNENVLGKIPSQKDDEWKKLWEAERAKRADKKYLEKYSLALAEIEKRWKTIVFTRLTTRVKNCAIKKPWIEEKNFDH